MVLLFISSIRMSITKLYAMIVKQNEYVERNRNCFVPKLVSRQLYKKEKLIFGKFILF